LQITSPRRATDKLKYLAGSESAMGAFIADIPAEAIAAQAFGVPWYRVDGEGFWGQDRLEFVERALQDS
jgi:2-hydroxychromene-2-carboxylate isomerase